MRAGLICLAALLLGAAQAQQVSLNGALGPQTALLVIDGQVHSVRVGQTVAGVRLLALQEGRAQLDVGGRRFSIGLGDVPVAQGGGVDTRAAGRVQLFAGSNGHFLSAGSINGRAVQFMVDTGASLVALSQDEAERLGLRWREGQALRINTANGVVAGHLIRLQRVRLGDAEVLDVPAAVVPAAMPHILLGNSFLQRFQMRRENDVLTLERRY